MHQRSIAASIRTKYAALWFARHFRFGSARTHKNQGNHMGWMGHERRLVREGCSEPGPGLRRPWVLGLVKAQCTVSVPFPAREWLPTPRVLAPCSDWQAVFRVSGPAPGGDLRAPVQPRAVANGNGSGVLVRPPAGLICAAYTVSLHAEVPWVCRAPPGPCKSEWRGGSCGGYTLPGHCPNTLTTGSKNSPAAMPKMTVSVGSLAAAMVYK